MRVLDWFPPLVMLGLAAQDFDMHPHRAAGALLTLTITAPLLIRRRWPVTAFALMAVAALMQWALDLRLIAAVGLLIAFYTVANRATIWLVLAAAAVLELGCVMALARWHPDVSIALSFILLSGMVTAAGVLGAYARVRGDYLSELQDRAERAERERDQHVQLAAVQERTRIAREMHDSVAHHLTVMVALANGAAATTVDDPHHAAAVMTSVAQTGRQALTETRRLLGVLRAGALETPDRTPQPDLNALAELFDHVRTAGLPVAYVVTGRPLPLPPPLELTLYRIVQEALTNCLKHAGDHATAAVRLDYRSGLVRIEVQDSGIGSTPALSATGHGLRGMRERVEAWSGTLSSGPIVTTGGGGWRIAASIPVRDAPDGADHEPATGEPLYV